MTRCIAAMLAACAALTAHAQYPEKPVRVVVSTVPGPLDTFARMVLDKMSAALKQPFVVENKPGAGGNIAADMGPSQRRTATRCSSPSTRPLRSIPRFTRRYPSIRRRISR